MKSRLVPLTLALALALYAQGLAVGMDEPAACEPACNVCAAPCIDLFGGLKRLLTSPLACRACEQPAPCEVCAPEPACPPACPTPVLDRIRCRLAALKPACCEAEEPEPCDPCACGPNLLERLKARLACGLCQEPAPCEPACAPCVRPLGLLKAIHGLLGGCCDPCCGGEVVEEAAPTEAPAPLPAPPEGQST